VRVEQTANSGQSRDLGWKPIVVADTGDAIAGPHRKQHFGRRRHERNDALRDLPGELARCGSDQRGGDRASSQDLRNSSHKNTGPPMIAVMMPTGNSDGAMIVRAMRSHPIRNAAPNSAEAGSTSR